jgi:FkbM family methyltransferase
MTMDAMLKRLAERVQPATVIDVGASDGRWSALALHYWQAARILLIEADPRHWAALDAFASVEGRHAVRAMAGDHVGFGHFASDPHDPWGGQGSEHPRADTREVPCTTVDHEVVRIGLPGPFLLKLDTHGFERQILAGAQGVLAGAVALVIEAYTCTLQPGAWRFWDLCDSMAIYGFAPTDMADVMRRPLDGRLWQMDLCFERASAPHVGECRYK